MEKKFVHFRDLLPSHMKEQLKPAPMFSPTTTARLEQEQQQPTIPIFVGLNHQKTKQHSFLHGKENVSPFFKSDLQRTVVADYQTPMLASHHHHLHHLSSPNAGTVGSDHDVFFSPRTHMSSVAAASTPFSFITHSSHQTSSSSKSTLPSRDMLKYEFIQNCSSDRDLQQIIIALQASDRKCPSLMSTAKARLEWVRQQKMIDFSPSHGSLSLNISDDDDDNVDQDNDENQNGKIRFDPTSYVRSHHIGPAPPPPRPATLANQRNVLTATNPAKEIQLSQEVEQLTQQLKEIESARKAEQTDFWFKMKALQESKAQVEQTVERLQKDMHATKESKRELLTILDALRQESQRLQRDLATTRKLQAETATKAQQIERRLTEKVQDLETELARTKFTDRKNHQLDLLLKSAHRNLNEIKKERDAMLSAIIDASGKQVENVRRQYCAGRAIVVLFFCLT